MREKKNQRKSESGPKRRRKYKQDALQTMGRRKGEKEKEGGGGIRAMRNAMSTKVL